MGRNFLLEIGCENLPSSYLDIALGQLEKKCASNLEEKRVGFDSACILGTPNRIVIFVTDLAGKQKTVEEEITGPPISAAVSDRGEYTKAAYGFARSQNVSAEELKKVRRKKGEYLAVVKKIQGRNTDEILMEVVPDWITGLKFPKTMRWDGSGLHFARPIRWILSFLGKKVFKITIGSVSSGRKTRVNPFLDEYTEVENIDGYFSLMKENGIVLDPVKRREKVAGALRREARKIKAKAVPDDKLVATVANLLESPVPFTGGFEDSFLKLPRRVIVTALRSHQKYFSVESADGKLKPFFIAFADGVRKNRKEIIGGYERVLQARLADAEFYYNEDTSLSLSEMAGKLEDIVWMEGLGSLAEKSSRMEKLALWIMAEWNPADDGLSSVISRAAKLAKADLASEMVRDGKEFTLLEGYMGREYARVSGEVESVAEAVYQHNLPRFAGDDIPEGYAGVILSCADKIDNISGGYILHCQPTGSVDPYALRRQAMGVLRLMIAKEIPVSLPGAVNVSLSLFKDVEKDPSLSGSIYEFFSRRFFNMLRAEGFAHDIVTALMSAGWKVPFLTRKMAANLTRMREDGELSPFILAMKRIANIAGDISKSDAGIDGLEMLELIAGGDTPKMTFDPGLFKDKAEKDLFDAAIEAAAGVLRLRSKGREEMVFSLLTEELVEPVNRYFDEVLVNCNDEKIRKNRLSFLRALGSAFSYTCDYSKITEE
ncbi:MAG TPA: glycine--tRNA ligase subunit beta [Candidatus Krumholzibacteriaceae bacterium]|nr:glycine--tRNA ligase subunit beta [Candidatus Krumholzibacteriaceae bacterium]